jgi:tetratricopeptide (TPR) repeat protein
MHRLYDHNLGCPSSGACPRRMARCGLVTARAESALGPDCFVSPIPIIMRFVPPAPTTTPHVPDHEMVRRIGVGSYGEVWLARNIVGTWRAVKVVRRARFDSERPYEREFNGIQKFEPISRSHPSQVDILQIGRNDSEGYFYYVMELADDASVQPDLHSLSSSPAPTPHSALRDPHSYRPHTLKDDSEQHRRFPAGECIEIGIALTEALEHLHNNGLVHRDIKPSNIVFVGGRPKLADIGLVTDADATRTYVGTEGFLPPEGTGTPQADLFALGKVLYEISTGKDRREFPQAPADLDALPDRKQFLELAEVIERASDPDPKRRYASARQMHDDLVLIRQGASVREQYQRKERLAAVRRYGSAVAFVAAVFVLGAAVATWLRTRSPREAQMVLVAPDKGTKSAAALNEFHLGRFWVAKRSARGFSNALTHFEQALEHDPKFPHAHAARAECFNLMASYGHGTPAELFPLARDAALQALRLNSNVVEAHLALALYQRSYEWNWSGAEESFRRALALDPQNAAAHQWLSSLLSVLGRVDEAVEHAQRAVQLEPSSLSINANLAQRLYLARRHQESIEQYRQVLRMDASFEPAYRELSRVYGQTQLLYESAKARLDAFYRAEEPRDVVAMLHDHMLKYGTIRFWLKYAEYLAEVDPPRSALLAEALLRGGDTNGALRALAAAVEARDPEVIYLNVEPLYDGLRQHPEFVKLCARLGFDTGKGSEPIVQTLTRRLTEAERQAGMTPDEKGAGFRPLFDGVSLKGWASDATNWVVSDGVLYRAADGGSLRYERETIPDNFELRFEWKTCPGGDGGVNYRPGAVEYQIIDHSNRVAQTRPDRRPGALVGCMPGKSVFANPVGEWNEGRIICRGTEIEHWLNGRRVFRINYRDQRMAPYIAQLAAMEKRLFQRETGNVRARGGHLQLLDHGTDVWFRRLRWRTLE